MLSLTPVVLMFYDGPDPGDSFAMFDGIIPVSSGTLEQPFTTFVAAQATQLIQNNRGTSHTVSVSAVTLPLLEAVKGEVQVTSSFTPLSLLNLLTLTLGQSLTAQMPLHSGSLVSGGVDPFLNYGQYTTDSAYPHADSPLLVSTCLQ